MVLVAAVTDESPIATSPAEIFAVAPRPNANAPSCPASATEPSVVALAADATEPGPTAVALVPEAFEPPIAIEFLPEALP